MADAAHAWTDDEVARMEARLMRMYRRAEREMIATWREYMEKYARDIEGAQREYDALKNGGDAEAIRKKGRELAQLKREKLMTGQHWRNMLMQVAERYAGVNAEAVAYINGRLPEIFLHNYNAAQHQIAADAPGYSFELADRDTVAFLTMYEDAQLLPEAELNRSADISWNRRRVNGAMLQGILQGDSIPRLAKRLAGVTGANAAASIRLARTATTGAENRGRIESYKRAEAMGVKLEQEWMATLDGRTRHSHRQMHGKRVKVGEKFDNGCRWPGDPDAPGVEIYNCRCCLVAAVEGADNELVTDSKKLDTDFEMWRAGGSGARDAEPEQGAATQAAQAAQEPPKGFAEVVQSIRDALQGQRPTEAQIMQAGQALQREYADEWPKYKSEMDAAVKKHVEGIEAQLKQIKEKREELYDGLFAPGMTPDRKAAMLDKIDEMNLEVRRLMQQAVDAQSIAMREHSPGMWLRGKIGKVREVGAQGLEARLKKEHFGGSRSKEVPRLLEAYDYYPRDWIIRSMERGKLKPKSVSRGYYSDKRQEIALSEGRGVAVHELGHRMERAVPGILEAEREFYERRTAGETLEWLGRGYGRNEVARKDKFVHPYMGKDYGGSAYELVSMGFQYAYTEPESLAADPDMQAWIFGLLALM